MIMMSFCKRSVHSFLGTTTTTNSNNDNVTTLLKSPPSPRCRDILSPVDGLSLIAVTCNNHNHLKPSNNNVLESSTLIKSTDGGSGSVSGSGVGTARKDSGGFGFIDDIGGGVDGLMSCTESLGFESSDERRTDEQLDQLLGLNEERESEMCTTMSKRNNPQPQWRKRRMKVRSERRSFPPPLSSLKQNGQPSFYLRPVRKDGRLELKEVRIDRAEVLHASRSDGRLRLHLIRDEIDEDEEEEEIEDEPKIEGLEKVEDDETESVGEWKLPAVTNAVGGDGFRRCYELVSHHHHHSNSHVWSQHCVTTG